MSRSDLYDVTVDLVHETEKAYLVTDGTKDNDGELNKVWIPKSQCELDRSTNPPTLTARESLLKEKGLI